MRIEQRGDVLFIEDGTGANLGAGVLAPAILVGVGSVLVWPQAAGNLRLYQGALAFAVTAVALALINPPRTAEFDGGRREVRLAIGWPPILGQRMIIPFDTIREAKISEVINLGENLGRTRPVFVLTSGKKIFVSTYKRSPKISRTIIDRIQAMLNS